MQSFNHWVEKRQNSVVGAQGDLSLIQMIEVNAETTVQEVAGIWKPTKVEQPGLTLMARAEDQLSVDGQLIEGQLELIPDVTVVTTIDGRTMMATSQPESNHLLAIWDEQADSLQAFKKIDRYSYNAEAVVEGFWLADDQQQLFSFEHTSDRDGTSRQHVSRGSILMNYEGNEYKLRSFAAGDQHIIVFRDVTSGNETYDTGRMLLVKPDEQGKVILDFNYAFLPPCAFSMHFNCPMPPFSNRIRAEIKAGEKNVLMNKI